VTGEFDNTTPAISPRFIFSGTYDAEGNPEGAELVSDISNLRVDPDFRNPYTDQFTLGIERELLKNLGVSAHYVYKRGRDYGGYRDVGGQYETVPYVDDQGTDATGQTILVQSLVNDPSERLFELTNPDRMFSRFHGLTLQVTKRMADHWQMVSSLVLARSTGRVGSSRPNTSASGGPAGNQSGLAGTFGRNPNDFINTDGRLIGDRPFTFKTQLVYELPKGFLVGVNYLYQSGRPWARLVRVPGLGISTTILTEKIDGSRKVSNQSILDLKAQWEFSLGGPAKMAVFADVLNLTNESAFEGVLDRLGTSDNFGLPTEFIYPRRVMVGAKFRF
jgi:hypothetical protein